jgi:steroid delta-isomerase-like uncharacterized protein
MNHQSNKDVVRTFFQVYNTKDYSQLFECMAADYFDNSLPQVRCIQDAIAILQSTHRSFPDIQVEIHDLIAEDDQVVFRGRFRGTHMGEFMGQPATGACIDFEAIEIFKLNDGKITESWGYWPSGDLLKQLRPKAPQ